MDATKPIESENLLRLETCKKLLFSYSKVREESHFKTILRYFAFLKVTINNNTLATITKSV